MTTEPSSPSPAEGDSGRDLVDELVAGALHDLKGPLAIASGFVGLLRERLVEGRSPDPEIVEMITTIERSHERMSRLLTTLVKELEPFRPEEE